jgi:hypothetical protein
MPRVGFESTPPVFQQANAFRALDRSATVISKFFGLILIAMYKTASNVNTNIYE